MHTSFRPLFIRFQDTKVPEMHNMRILLVLYFLSHAPILVSGFSDFVLGH
jgi:hypothetical protein